MHYSTLSPFLPLRMYYVFHHYKYFSLISQMHVNSTQRVRSYSCSTCKWCSVISFYLPLKGHMARSRLSQGLQAIQFKPVQPHWLGSCCYDLQESVMTLVTDLTYCRMIDNWVASLLSGTSVKNASLDSRSTPPRTHWVVVTRSRWYLRREKTLSSDSTSLPTPPMRGDGLDDSSLMAHDSHELWFLGI